MTATATIAKSGLESGAKGELAAALWLRIAEAAAAESNAEKALEAVRCAIAEDSQSIPARALERHGYRVLAASNVADEAAPRHSLRLHGSTRILMLR